MSTVLEYPDTELIESDYHAFNERLWDRLSADESLAALDFRIETDRYGQMIMSPPPAPSHGNKQLEIGFLLKTLVDDGKVITECPISTREGVKAIDVAWCSASLWKEFKSESCFLRSPEICVEVESPSNTQAELTDKRALYFAEGAHEVWVCDRKGKMLFFLSSGEDVSAKSTLVPEFPSEIR